MGVLEMSTAAVLDMTLLWLWQTLAALFSKPLQIEGWMLVVKALERLMSCRLLLKAAFSAARLCVVSIREVLVA